MITKPTVEGYKKSLRDQSKHFGLCHRFCVIVLLPYSNELSGCVIDLAYRCKSGVLMQSRVQNPRAFWQAGGHFWRAPADQRARGLCTKIEYSLPRSS